MKEVYFKKLMIADLQNRTARVQSFEKGLNVVTSADNHVGKSSLLKSLYYTLGAEVDFDSVWDSLMDEYLKAGGQKIIDERTQKWEATYGTSEMLP